MSLTREDRMRELELLPLWQLRKKESYPHSLAEFALNIELKSDLANLPNIESVESFKLRIIVSNDADYLFLLTPLKTVEEETLLQNMLKAMQVTSFNDIVNRSLLDVNSYSSKVLIAIGEPAAQSLLNSKESVDNLRGQLHHHNSLKVIATYHPSHLLKVPSDKSKAWKDLCMAMTYIKSIGLT